MAARAQDRAHGRSNPARIIETEPFSVPCNVVPTDNEVLAHVDLNSQCADTPVITRGAGNTYTIKCTDTNGCPCTGSGSWTVEPCEALRDRLGIPGWRIMLGQDR